MCNFLPVTDAAHQVNINGLTCWCGNIS